MRYLLISLAAAALLAACQHDHAGAPADSDVYYTCSMDPQVTAFEPGSCPICKMPLTLMRKGKGLRAGEIQLTDQQIQLGNISYDTVRLGPVGEAAAYAATLSADLNKTYTISARMAGRIDRLYVKSEGDQIAKGRRLYDLYSEELQAAKQEYLLALQKQKNQQSALVDYGELARQSRQKLLFWASAITNSTNWRKADALTTIRPFSAPTAAMSSKSARKKATMSWMVRRCCAWPIYPACGWKRSYTSAGWQACAPASPLKCGSPTSPTYPSAAALTSSTPS